MKLSLANQKKSSSATSTDTEANAEHPQGAPLAAATARPGSARDSGVDLETHGNPADSPPAVVITETPKKPQRSIFIGLVLATVTAGAVWYVRQIGRETTDDAQIDADVVALPARTAAVVQRIAIADNQTVKAGDLLVELDAVPAQARLAQAQAALDAATAAADAADADARVAELNAWGNRSMARASLVGASSSVQSSHQQVAEATAAELAAQVAAAQARHDYERTAQLATAGSVAAAELEHAQAKYDEAQAALVQAQAHLRSVQSSTLLASSRVQEASARLSINDVDALVIQAKSRATVAHAQVAVARTARDSAQLDLSYTRIVAPQDGVISKRSVGVGQMVSVGQSIAQFVPRQQMWVTANFKETQLAHLRPGQRVDISVDANSSAKVLGVIDSFSGATGARFALLPPDNASGNFTKVVQRVPVRIRLTEVPAAMLLVPGMSVELVAHTR